MRQWIQLCGLTILLIRSTTAWGQVVDMLNPDARSIGMASVGVTTSQSPAAVHFNPSLLLLQSGPQIFTTLPVLQLVPQLDDDIFLREFGVSVPLAGVTAVPLAFGFHYRRLAYGVTQSVSPIGGTTFENLVEQVYGLTAAVRPLPWLALGGKLQWLDLAFGSKSVPNVSLGILLAHRFVTASGTYFEGRIGTSLRRLGPDITNPGSGFQLVDSYPQDRDVTYGISALLGDRHARVVLAVDLIHPMTEGSFGAPDQDRGTDAHYGVEIQMLTVAGRVGYEDSEAFQDSRHGIGIDLPFPGNVMGSFDYGRQSTDIGIHDHYTMGLRYSPDEHRRLERNGYRIRSRFAVGIVGAANSPNDLIVDAGPYVRISSQVGFTDGLDLETWFGWGLLGETRQEDGVTRTFLNFGAGLRRTFDLGAYSPYGLAGVSGSRLGTSMTGQPPEPGAPSSTVRSQLIAPGYTIGVGFIASELLDDAGLDLGLLVHSVKLRGRFDTWIELSLGISIP